MAASTRCIIAKYMFQKELDKYIICTERCPMVIFFPVDFKL